MTQTVPDISPLMPMHQDPLLVWYVQTLMWRHCNDTLWDITRLVPHRVRCQQTLYSSPGELQGVLGEFKVYILPLSLHCCMWYHDILGRVITTPDCIGLNSYLTHWSRVTHKCDSNLAIIGSDNALSPGRRRAITRTNARILFIGPLGTNFTEILIEIHTFSFKEMWFKRSQQNGGHFVSVSMC